MFRDTKEERFKPEEVLDYLRKSQSDDPLLTVEEVLQKHEDILDEWAVRHLGAKVPAENKFREVVSGETIKERPEINKVLRLIESPRIKAVKVVEPQRLTRGDLEDIGRLMKLFKHTDTKVITPERIYDLRDEYDWNAIEQELKRGNDYLIYYKKIQKRGKLASLRAGNYIFSKPPYGYEKIKVKDGKKDCPTLIEKPGEADVIRMIFDMYGNQKLGSTTICNKLNDLGIKPAHGKYWGATTIAQILQNVHYVGKVRYDLRPVRTIVEDGEFRRTRPKNNIEECLLFDGRHKALVSQEIFDKVQERIGKNHRAPATVKLRNPFAGLLYCKNCGRVLSYARGKSEKIPVNYIPRFYCPNQRHCGTGSCKAHELIERVCQILRECIADFEVRIANNAGDSVKLHENIIKQLEAKMEALETKELAQWDAQSDPDPARRMPPEIFQRLNERLLAEKEEVRDALCRARESMPEPVDYAEKVELFSAALELIQDDSEENAFEKNELLKACIERIDYSRPKPKRIPRGKVEPRFPNLSGTWKSESIEISVKLRV